MRDALELRMQARRLGLDAPGEFWTFGDIEALNRLWNGYGPDKWPECVRAVMTWIYRNFEASALIHDFEYTFSDGSTEGWQVTDDRFYKNLKTQRDELYPWFSPWLLAHRAAATLKIRAAKLALDMGGYTAYLDAFRRRIATALPY